MQNNHSTVSIYIHTLILYTYKQNNLQRVFGTGHFHTYIYNYTQDYLDLHVHVHVHGIQMVNWYNILTCSCWPLPSNQSFYKLIASYGEGWVIIW